METRGRKPKYDTPQQLRAAIEAYFTECETTAVFPDYAGMKLALKLSEKTIKSYQDEKHTDFMQYREIFEYAKDRRESWLARKMTSDNKAAQGCLNALKQPVNGGYTDRPVESCKNTLNINLVGVGGWDAMK